MQAVETTYPLPAPLDHQRAFVGSGGRFATAGQQGNSEDHRMIQGGPLATTAGRAAKEMGFPPRSSRNLKWALFPTNRRVVTFWAYNTFEGSGATYLGNKMPKKVDG